MSARIAFSWLIVLVPILYGLVETIRKVATLFNG